MYEFVRVVNRKNFSSKDRYIFSYVTLIYSNIMSKFKFKLRLKGWCSKMRYLSFFVRLECYVARVIELAEVFNKTKLFKHTINIFIHLKSIYIILLRGSQIQLYFLSAVGNTRFVYTL